MLSRALLGVFLVATVSALAPHPHVDFAKAGLHEGLHNKPITLHPLEEIAQVDLQVDDGFITAVEFHFTGRVAAPPVEVVIYGAYELPSNPRFRTQVPFNVSAVSVPLRDVGLRVADLPDEIRIGLWIKEQVTTEFVYEMESIVPELFDGALYDLRPGNATMNFKFMARIVNGTLGLWVTRRPPIPPFVVLVSVDGQEFMRFTDYAAPAGGIGVEDVIANVGRFNDSDITLRAVFFERDRAEVARLLISDPVSFIQEAVESRDRAVHKSTDYKHLALQFQYHENTKHIACNIMQPHPLKDLMLSVTDATGNVVFREEERQIPHYDAAGSVQFGWYNVIPIDLFSGETAIAVPPLMVEARFTHREAADPLSLLKEWISDSGGDTRGVGDVVSERSSRSRRSLIARQPFRKGDMVFAVPYRLLLTDEVVLANQWVQHLARNSSVYRAQAQALGLGDSSIHFMFMTFFAIVQPNSDIDGTNWRLYFDTLPEEEPPLPNFFTADEMEVFSFAPVVAEHRAKIDKLWTAEFDSIITEAPWLQEHVDVARYRAIRGHLESRIFNISGVLTMIPMLDFLSHDDDPSIVLHYDDAAQMILFEAARDLAMEDSLTVDYGAADKTKLEFFFQFGFVPQGALNSAVVQYDGRKFLLTHKRESRRELLEAVQHETTGETGSFDELSLDLSEKVITTFKDVLVAHQRSLPLRVDAPATGMKRSGIHQLDSEAFLHAAQKLLAAEKATLERHIRWCAHL